MAIPGQRRGFSFGRAQRLRGSREFARLRKEGERRVCGGLVLNWHRSGAGTEVRLGLVTSRRLGGAVIRSRVRRMIREAFRLNRHEISGPASLVLVARPSIVGKTLWMVERDLRRCLREAGLWAGTMPESSPRRATTGPTEGKAPGPAPETERVPVARGLNPWAGGPRAEGPRLDQG